MKCLLVLFCDIMKIITALFRVGSLNPKILVTCKVKCHFHHDRVQGVLYPPQHRPGFPSCAFLVV